MLKTQITVGTDPEYGSETPVSSNLVSRVLGHSNKTITKAVHSGVIPDPTTFGVLRTLEKRPVVASARINGVPIPVLRLGELTAVNDPGDPRHYIGYEASMSNADFLAAVDRWWTDAGKEQVLAACAVLVARAGWLVGLVEIDSNKPIVGHNAYGQIRYNAHLVARQTSVSCALKIEPMYEGSGLAEIARQSLGNRVLGGQGGSFTRLSGDRDS